MDSSSRQENTDSNEGESSETLKNAKHDGNDGMKIISDAPVPVGVGLNQPSNSKSPESEAVPIRSKTQSPQVANVHASKLNFSKSGYSLYFDEIGAGDDGKRKVRCRVTPQGNPLHKCNQSLTLQDNTYTNLFRHLKTKHNISYVPKKPSSSGIQLTLEECKTRNEKYPRNHLKQVKFDEGVINMIALDGLPFNIVRGVGFRSLVADLDAKITVKNRSAYMKKIKRIIKTRTKPTLREDLKKITKRSCHFSCDIWSTKRREGVLGVAAHFINSNWEIKKKTIAFKRMTDRHKVEYISEIFHETLKEIDVPADWGGVVVTDNATNMKKCFDMIGIVEDEFGWSNIMAAEDNADAESEQKDEESDENESDLEGEMEIDDDSCSEKENVEDAEDSDLGTPDIPVIVGHHACVTHTLQLVINAALKEDHQSKLFIQYVHSIMVFIKKSVIYSDMLKNETNLDVVLPGPTRWNATLDMIDRFRQERFFVAIKDILDKAQVAVPRKRCPKSPNISDQLRAETLYNILRPLGDATDQLQSEGSTANLVVLSVVNAYRRLIHLSVEHFSSLRKKLIHHLILRMSSSLKVSEFLMASILDPRQKDRIFKLHNNNIGTAEPQPDTILELPTHSTVVQTLRAVFDMDKFTGNKQSDCDKRVMISSPASSSSVFGILNELDPTPLPERSEVDVYLEEPPVEEAVCPLLYWKVNEARFPNLSRLAKRYLAVPASSSEIERIFSISRAIARLRRAKISVTSMPDLLLIRQEKEECLRLRLARK